MLSHHCYLFNTQHTHENTVPSIYGISESKNNIINITTRRSFEVARILTTTKLPCSYLICLKSTGALYVIRYSTLRAKRPASSKKFIKCWPHTVPIEPLYMYIVPNYFIQNRQAMGLYGPTGVIPHQHKRYIPTPHSLAALKYRGIQAKEVCGKLCCR